MSAETLFWLGIIFISPAFYHLGKLSASVVFDKFDKRKKYHMIVEYAANGVVKELRVNLDEKENLDKVIKILSATQIPPSIHDGGRAE